MHINQLDYCPPSCFPDFVRVPPRALTPIRRIHESRPSEENGWTTWLCLQSTRDRIFRFALARKRHLLELRPTQRNTRQPEKLKRMQSNQFTSTIQDWKLDLPCTLLFFLLLIIFTTLEPHYNTGFGVHRKSMFTVINHSNGRFSWHRMCEIDSFSVI